MKKMSALVKLYVMLVVKMIVLLNLATKSTGLDVCQPLDVFITTPKLYPNNRQNNLIFILYDVNPVEGFNLRRDVYIRLAVFLYNLRKVDQYKNAILVLPPLRRLYHWKSQHIFQDIVFWNHFFDMKSMKKFVPLLDIYEYFDKMKNKKHNIEINKLYQLQHFEEMFENGHFVEKFELFKCSKKFNSFLQEYNNISIKENTCLKFQGGAILLQSVLKREIPKSKFSSVSFMFSNAEIVLHDEWGNSDYWRARRSMRFSKKLVNIAKKYRMKHFNSSDDNDLVQRPSCWTQEKTYRGAKGGEYISVHLRRADFLNGREKTTPTLKSAASQIKSKLALFGLDKVFVSSDCSMLEFKNLRSYLGEAVKVYRFTLNTFEEKEKIKDGGIAIIDQIICSHARYFMGTFESTFTYRIYEEREILGFPKEMTFNTLCKNEDYFDCKNNTIWPISY